MSTGSPRVSVIIPAYQAAGYLSRTLESAQQQTVADIEILVVDDGSTDGTADIVRAAAANDPRVHLIHQANAGVAAARNTAIENARSPFVAPLDADDLWHPEKLEAQLHTMEEADPDCVLVYSWYLAIDDEDKIVGFADFRPRVSGNGLNEFALQNVVGASSPLLRRSAVLAVGGYDDSLRARGGQGSEDWKLFTQLAATGTVEVVPRFLMGYRRVPDSMSRDAGPAIASHLAAIRDLRSSLPVPPQVFDWSEIIHGVFMVGTYRREAAWPSAARVAAWVAWRAVRHDPGFLLRASFREYVRMRRVRKLTRDRASTVQGVRFQHADFRPLEAASLSELETARSRFVAAVVSQR